MTLKDFLKKHGSLAKLSKATGISSTLLSYYKNNKREVPLECCMDIETATGGAVTRKDLRPRDWKKHWPELAEQEL